MSNGHRTSAITRPARDVTRIPVAASRRDGSTDRDPTRVGDLTRPIAADRQLVTHRTNRWLLAALGFAVVGALLAALFVLPVQAFRRQTDDLAAKQAELQVLQDTNRPLQGEVDRLMTTEGARDAARDELGMVDRGEERTSLTPVDNGPLPLPSGWPYDTVSQIVAVRALPPTTTP